MNPILQAIENAGVTPLESDKAAIEAKVATLSAEGVQEVASIIESKLPSSGLLALADGEIKSVIASAEPQVEGLVNGEFDTLYVELENALKNAAGSPAAVVPAAAEEAPAAVVPEASSAVEGEASA